MPKVINAEWTIELTLLDGCSLVSASELINDRWKEYIAQYDNVHGVKEGYFSCWDDPYDTFHNYEYTIRYKRYETETELHNRLKQEQRLKEQLELEKVPFDKREEYLDRKLLAELKEKYKEE